MDVEFGETKTFQDNIQPSRTVSGININWGCYAPCSPFSWYGCREQFCEKYDYNSEGFFISHPHGAEADLAAFIRKTELILSLVNNVGDYSKFAKTNRPYAMWVEPSPFWRNCRFKFSLLTILLRSGIAYRRSSDNYEEALFSDEYAKETKLAIKRFLFGHTQFVWEQTGPTPDKSEKIAWRDFFLNKSVEGVRHKLIMPNDATVSKSVIGIGSIWN